MEREIVWDVILRTHSTWCRLIALVVMDDHVHVLVELTGRRRPSQLAQAWKSIASREIITRSHRTAPVWQAEYFDRWMEDGAQIDACIRYIVDNPLRRWPNCAEYRWVHARELPPKAL